jgi:hypothetical protein
MSRPQSIAFPRLADSPIGLAAWIYAVQGHLGQQREQSSLHIDAMLDDIMLY